MRLDIYRSKPDIRLLVCLPRADSDEVITQLIDNPRESLASCRVDHFYKFLLRTHKTTIRSISPCLEDSNHTARLLHCGIFADTCGSSYRK